MRSLRLWHLSYIRGEAHSVVKAILRNLLHATHHIGQIDLLASALRN